MKSKPFIAAMLLLAASHLGAAAAADNAPAEAASQSLSAAMNTLRVQCGEPDYAPYGHFDYRDPTQAKLIQTANRHHFDQNIQTLTRGQTSDRILPDLDYILRMLPNHYGALQTVSKYFLRGGRQDEFLSAECYFHQALAFVPDDATVQVLYATHLSKSGQQDSARVFLEAALAASDAAEIHYNAGLLFADMKDYESALRHAHRAYALGYPLPGLRRKLERLGKWRDPPAEQQAQEAPAN